jgi:hypothetical protein
MALARYFIAFQVFCAYRLYNRNRLDIDYKKLIHLS